MFCLRAGNKHSPLQFGPKMDQNGGGMLSLRAEKNIPPSDFGEICKTFPPVSKYNIPPKTFPPKTFPPLQNFGSDNIPPKTFPPPPPNRRGECCLLGRETNIPPPIWTKNGPKSKGGMLCLRAGNKHSPLRFEPKMNQNRRGECCVLGRETNIPPSDLDQKWIKIGGGNVVS